ncbi:MAG TPA: PPOX class F420-dependent oxidoreductase [Mycobacteriales bacterium]|jgi:PPOX class probable F420-dependent enzyme|nr:PPOX class F420-dependent oxidoreductase [Mycobacteriales bacterium]
MPTLPDTAKAWLDAVSFATLATVNADGSPQTTVHWVARDGDDVLLSTVRGRRHARNLDRDPRVSVLVMDPANPYAYVEVRGTATLTEEGARDLIDDLAEKYRGVRPYPGDAPDAVRVVIRVPPEHVVSYGI